MERNKPKLPHEQTEWFKQTKKEQEYFKALSVLGKSKIDRQHGYKVDETAVVKELRNFQALHKGVMWQYQREQSQETQQKQQTVMAFVEFVFDGTDPNLPKDVLAPKERDNSSPSLGFGR